MSPPPPAAISRDAPSLALWVGLVVAGYLCGSIPFGPIVARVRGVNLRSIGSGNIGATNVARALGRPLGLLVFLCDAAKGGLPVLMVHGLLHGSPGAGPEPVGDADRVDWIVATVGAAAFLGHLFPPWLGFRGGKGVATAFGVFAALALPAAVLAGVTFLGVYATTRLSSLGSLVGATVFLPAVWFSTHQTADLALALFMWALIVVRHRDNIGRLRRREELRGR